MQVTDDFWAPRACYLEPIAEFDEAADLLSRAADRLIAGDLDGTRACLQRADLATLHAHASRVMGKIDATIIRCQDVTAVAPVLPRSLRAKRRRPAASVEQGVFHRDGYRCRYCTCRVVDPRARNYFEQNIPAAVRWGDANKDQHAAFFAITAVADHVVPHSRGGTSDASNLVTSCGSCNYGKGEAALKMHGLLDPRLRAPIVDAWDGLTRLLAAKRGDAASRSRPVKKSSTSRSAQPLVADWFVLLDQNQPGTSRGLLHLLSACANDGVSWQQHKTLQVYVDGGGKRLAVFGIAPDGTMEIPWDIGAHKDLFLPFASALAAIVPGGHLRETEKMWRVDKGYSASNRRVTLNVVDILQVADGVQAALRALAAALRLST